MGWCVNPVLPLTWGHARSQVLQRISFGATVRNKSVKHKSVECFKVQYRLHVNRTLDKDATLDDPVLFLYFEEERRSRVSVGARLERLFGIPKWTFLHCSDAEACLSRFLHQQILRLFFSLISVFLSLIKKKWRETFLLLSSGRADLDIMRSHITIHRNTCLGSGIALLQSWAGEKVLII